MKNHLLKIITLAFVMQATAVFSQPVLPDDGEIFRDDVVARIDISIDPDTLQWIYDNPYSNIEWHATFEFNNGTIHDTIENIGFRLRGNTSRQSAKKSFKVSFNTYESGKKYYGLEKMNLNGEHNDPTVARSKICWDLCRALGIPAPRSNHVRVYINNNFYGLYINVEHIDEEFAESRFLNQDGNLFKCLYPATLEYIGNDPNLYKYEGGGRSYALKTNTAIGDYTDLANFIDILNNTPLDDLPCELEKVFNVQDYLKIAAMDVVTANWDGYIYNKNNFYLYHNTASDKFEYIPYDLDNTFGIDWFSIDWAQRDVYSWNWDGEPRPLYTRLMQVQKYRDWFSWYLQTIKDELMEQTYYFEYLNEIRSKIYPYIQTDPYYPLDYGFTPADFLQSYETGLGGHVPYGLKDYTDARLGSLQNQLVINNIFPIVNYLKSEIIDFPGSVAFNTFVYDDEAGTTVNLLYSLNLGPVLSVNMANTDEHEYHVEIGPFTDQTIILYQVQADDIPGNTTIYPCDPLEITMGPGQDYELFINEFLADNVNGITDEAGEHEDWLEIYNGGSSPVWLGDKYLTDNPDNPDKWQFPDYTIQPQEFLLVWCDEDQGQGAFHTNFKLSANGETLELTDNDGTGYASIDFILYGPQEPDISYGRDPDGAPDWIFYNFPTPGISNTLSVIVDTESQRNGFYVYPNPAEQKVVFLSKTSTFSVFSVSGVMVMKPQYSDRIELGGLQSGIYFVKTIDGEITKFVIN